MEIFYTPHFKRQFRKFSPAIQDKFKKQIDFFVLDIHHPSLNTKKYDKERGIWQARVDRYVRFFFLIEKDKKRYTLLEIKSYPK